MEAIGSLPTLVELLKNESNSCFVASTLTCEKLVGELLVVMLLAVLVKPSMHRILIIN
jgi:hypothetical protein